MLRKMRPPLRTPPANRHPRRSPEAKAKMFRFSPCRVYSSAFLTECATGDSRVFGARERDIQRLLSRLLFVLFVPKQGKDILLLNNNLSYLELRNLARAAASLATTSSGVSPSFLPVSSGARGLPPSSPKRSVSSFASASSRLESSSAILCRA